MYPIITVSREFGSGGHSIAEKVAKELDIPFYDSAIVEKTAEESGYAKEFITEQGEYTSGLNKLFNANVFASNHFSSPQDQLFTIQSKIIIELARKGPCVIVGRCADYVLAEEGITSMNVFIHADTEHRKIRILERYGETNVSIEKRIQKKDKGRKAYYRYYTEREWGCFKNYQLNLDSGFLGEDACVEMIVTAAKNFDKQTKIQ